MSLLLSTQSLFAPRFWWLLPSLPLPHPKDLVACILPERYLHRSVL